MNEKIRKFIAGRVPQDPFASAITVLVVNHFVLFNAYISGLIVILFILDGNFRPVWRLANSPFFSEIGAVRIDLPKAVHILFAGSTCLIG